MALTINTNPAAQGAARSLSDNNKFLQKSLSRLSSGKRIISPADDAGGLAVSMKLGAAISRTKSAIANIQNSLSFSEVQDGALQSGARIIERMTELKSLSLDVMKSSSDKANYDTEFRALQQQLHSITSETFNGVSLFAVDASQSSTTAGVFGSDNYVVSVFTSDRGAAGAVVSLNKSLLLSALTFKAADAANGGKASLASNSGATNGVGAGAANTAALAAATYDPSATLGDWGISFFTQALENVASLRAENGATMARLQFSEDHLRLSKANLEAANSRIMDVDVAEESTQLAKYNILAQASAAMLAQANATSSTALMLLG